MQNAIAKIAKAIADAGIPDFGVVSYDTVLPLLPCRGVSRLPQTPKSVILCIFPYRVAEPPLRNISRYAMVEDYHVVATNLLNDVCNACREVFSGASFVPFVDNSPIREIPAAVLAGLGAMGQNGLLIHPRYGSYLFLGEIVTDLELPASEQTSAGCQNCGRCVAACPAHAITEKGVNPAMCLSHITQKKGALTPEEIALIRCGNLLWGCDRCQEVCPHNNALPETPIAAFLENIEPYVTRERIPQLVSTRAFGFRGVGVIERNFEILYGKKE